MLPVDMIIPAFTMEIQSIAYLDVQHDALAVFDDIEQGVVGSEEIWISGYKAGSSSVHGRVRVTAQEGGGSELIARAGVKLSRTSKTTFEADVSDLGIEGRTIKFPRQIIHPPYKKEKPTSAPLHINSIALSPQHDRLVVSGPDGFCAVVPATSSSTDGSGVQLKGHVGDVLDCKWFPSGKVILTASSDFTVRIFSAEDGINPRTLKGHTRAVASTHIIGVGKEVLSASKDGTIRLWNVGEAKELQQWYIETKRAIEGLVVLEDKESLKEIGMEEEERVMLASTKDGMAVVPWTKPGWFIPTLEEVGHQISMAYSTSSRLLATGNSDGTISLRSLNSLVSEAPQTPPKLFRRNDSPIYSLSFSASDLLIGTSTGLPCRVGIELKDDTISVVTKEEYAGWEAVGVECWTEGNGSVWCAGGEGGIRRY